MGLDISLNKIHKPTEEVLKKYHTEEGDFNFLDSSRLKETKRGNVLLNKYKKFLTRVKTTYIDLETIGKKAGYTGDELNNLYISSFSVDLNHKEVEEKIKRYKCEILDFRTKNQFNPKSYFRFYMVDDWNGKEFGFIEEMFDNKSTIPLIEVEEEGFIVSEVSYLQRGGIKDSFWDLKEFSNSEGLVYITTNRQLKLLQEHCEDGLETNLTELNTIPKNCYVELWY